MSSHFMLSSGDRIDVYHPTVIISVKTRVYAPITSISVDMHKVVIKEVFIGEQ